MIPTSEGKVVTPDERLQQVLGPERYQSYVTQRFVQVQSTKIPGRVYRITHEGRITYRDTGEKGEFVHWICIDRTGTTGALQKIADKFLLLTADEDYVLAIGVPQTGRDTAAKARGERYREAAKERRARVIHDEGKAQARLAA